MLHATKHDETRQDLGLKRSGRSQAGVTERKAGGINAENLDSLWRTVTNIFMNLKLFYKRK